MKGSEQTMPANGAELIADSKITQSPPGEARSARAVAGSRTTSPAGTATRGRRGRQDHSKANGEERFLLSTGSSVSDIPALGRECASEAEAVIDAFRERVPFYRVSEFQ